MPSRNIIKYFESESYYHVYSRGVNKQEIFRESKDKDYFINLFKRYLDPNHLSVSSSGYAYKKYNLETELLCYCLMDNHFHLLIYQDMNPGALTELMRSLLTAYTMYFNRKYERVGPLFQSRYKASKITNDPYLLHVTRYIHLNPHDYKDYRYSSIKQYCGDVSPAWLNPRRILEMFEDNSCVDFLKNYHEQKQALEELGKELANW